MLVALSWLQLFQKGIKVTVVCPGPIETSNNSGVKTSENKGSPEVSCFCNFIYYIKRINYFYFC